MGVLDFGKFYVDGNYVDEAPDVTKKNYLGVDMGKGSTEDDKKRSVVNEAFTTEECVTQTAKEAYMKILDKVGASFRRDILDVNTFEFVTDSLIKVCRHDAIQAEQCTYLVHFAGRCAVKTAEFKKLKPMCEALLERGLTAKIE